jgi:hypothetical protein
MSQQDTEVVREATGAFNRGDPDAVLRWCWKDYGDPKKALEAAGLRE